MVTEKEKAIAITGDIITKRIHFNAKELERNLALVNQGMKKRSLYAHFFLLTNYKLLRLI